ncbi:hypothetical protein ABPG72_020302 [Tetrahymena utriculariae]
MQQVKDLKSILSKEISNLQFNGSDQLLINEIEASQFKDEFVKLIRQTLNQINSKLSKDSETIFLNYQKIFEPKKVGQKKLDHIRDLIEESEINETLSRVKRKYELILLKFQNENESFNIQFISPLILDQNIKSIFRLHEDFLMASNFSSSENCNQFIQRYKSIISNQQYPLILFDRFAINLLLSSQENSPEELNIQDLELKNNGDNILSSRELVITSIYINEDLLLGLGSYQQLKIDQNVKRILLESYSIECFEFIFKSKKINYLQINRMYMCQVYDFANFFENIDLQQVDIGEIVISDISQTQDMQQIKYCLYYYQQLLNYRFLLRLYTEDEQKCTQGFYLTPMIKSYHQENIQESENEDIDEYLKIKQQEEFQKFQQQEGQVDQLQNRQFNFKDYSQFLHFLYINEEISQIFNLKYSSQLMAITVYKIFKGYFSIYRILYDLYQI